MPQAMGANAAPTLWSLCPPPGESGHTFASLVRAIVRCEHPRWVQSPAVILEPNGSTIEIRWCGACGALDLNVRGFGDWLQPGLAQAIGDGDRLRDLARDITARVDRLAQLAKEARAACDLCPSGRAELSTTLSALEVACDELRCAVRRAVGEGAP